MRNFPGGRMGTWHTPDKFVFKFISIFLSLPCLCSSTNFTYTLALSTGFLSSPPVTTMVTRDSVEAESVFALVSSPLSCPCRPMPKHSASDATIGAIFFNRLGSILKTHTLERHMDYGRCL